MIHNTRLLVRKTFDDCIHVEMEPPQSTEVTADVVLLDQQPTPGDEAVYTVAEFATEYKQSLPLRIRVVEGFCGKEER